MQKPSPRFLKTIGCLLAIPLGFCLLSAPFSFPIFSDIFKTIRHENFVYQKANYEPAARDLARLCQSDPDIFKNRSIYSLSHVTPAIAKLTPTAVIIGQDDGTIGCGGGFYHYGINIIRDQSFNSLTQNKWDIFTASESSSRKPLMSFVLDKSDHFSEQELQSALPETQP